jgi:MFS transporter, DHA2 family, multidrug resistance protein
VAKFGARQVVLVGTVAIATMLQLIDTSIVNVSLSQMMGNLGATLEDISWVVTSYAVANVVMIALSGWLAQRFGRKRYFVTSIVVFTLASLACGFSNNVWALVLFRFIQGMGGGGIMATGQAILVETFPREDLPVANAIYGMTVVIGPTIGPTLGGWITDHLSWNWIFYVNIPVGILATVLAWSFLPPPRHDSEAKSMDWGGILLLVAGIGSLQVVLERGQDEGWGESAMIVVLSAVAVVGIIWFLWHEWHVRWPVVHLRLLKSRAYATGVFFSFVQGFGLYSSTFLVPVFTQTLLGFTATDTGLLLLPGSISTAFMMPFIGKSMQRGVSPRLLAGTGFFLFFVFTQMLSRFTDQVGSQDFFWPLVVRGMGLGMLFIPLTTLALADLKGAEIPQGTAMTNMARQLGGSVGIALMTTFVSRRTTFHDSVLSEKVTEYGQVGLQRLDAAAHLFLSKGDTPWDARSRGIAALARTVHRQAALLSYLDAFRLVGIFFLVMLPFLLLFKKPERGGAVPEGVHAE